MPAIAMTLPSVEATVVSKVATQLSRKVMDMLGLPEETSLTVLQRGVSNPTADKKDNREVEPNENRVIVQLTDQYTESRQMQRAPYTHGRNLIYSDPDVGANLRAFYNNVELTLEFTVRLKSVTRLQNIRRTCRTAAGIKTPTYAHDVYYNYHLPDSIIACIYSIWDLREKQYGYGEKLDVYLKRTFPFRKLVRQRNAAGGNETPSIEEINTGIRGFFAQEDYYQEYEVNDNHIGGTMRFTYKAQMNLIQGVSFTFPLEVHQQPIPSAIVDRWMPYLDRYEAVVKPVYNYNIMKDKKNTRFFDADGGMRINPFDNYFPPATEDTATVLLTPISVSEEDRRDVADLKVIPEGYIPPLVRDYICSYPEKAVKRYHLPFGVEFYEVGRDDVMVDITIDSDGVIRTVSEMDPRKRHYLRIYILSDVSKCDTSHSTELLTNPERTLELFKIYDPEVTMGTSSDNDLIVIGDRQITTNSAIKTIKKLPQTNESYRKTRLIGRPTVGSFGLTTRRGR